MGVGAMTWGDPSGRARWTPAKLAYGGTASRDEEQRAFDASIAAGAILTMLADTMMPEAYEDGGKLVGVVTTLGFAAAFLIHSLD